LLELGDGVGKNNKSSLFIQIAKEQGEHDKVFITTICSLTWLVDDNLLHSMKIKE
jgi:hypothetical protein